MSSQEKAGCVECCVHARVDTFYLTGRAVFMIMSTCDMLCESYSLSGIFVVQCLRQTCVILNDCLPAALFKRFHVVTHLFISWSVHTKSKTFEHICVAVAPLDMCQINILFVSWSDNRLYCRQCPVSHQPQPPLLNDGTLCVSGLGDVTGRVNVYILNCKYGLLFRHLICCFHCMTITMFRYLTHAAPVGSRHFWARSQNCEKRRLASLCLSRFLSVRPYRTTLVPLDGFSLNLIFEDF